MMSHADSFKQYTALWHEHRAGRKSASDFIDGINRRGYEAAVKAAEAYRADPTGVEQASPHKLAAPDYGVNIFGVDTPADIDSALRCGVTTINSLPAVVANDSFLPTDELTANLPEGVTVCSLRSVPAHLQEAVAKALETTDLASALNAMLLSDGVLVHLAKGAHLERPLQLVNIAASTSPMLSARRIVILADEGSDMRLLLCDHTLSETVEQLSLEVIDVLVAPNASVELYDIEENTSVSRRWWRLNVHQGADSRFSAHTIYLHGGITRNEYNINVDGDHAETVLGGLAICAGAQIVDNQVTLRHSACHCTSRQLFKNALYDESRGGFGGKIIVEEGAAFTDAVQTNRNLLIGETARMTAAPQLEIYCDEVKCGHGATTGQLDDRAMFYMQSRGIPATEARNMLTQAFMADVIDNISYEVLRQRLHVLVEKRLSGAAASCDACASACRSIKNQD